MIQGALPLIQLCTSEHCHLINVLFRTLAVDPKGLDEIGRSRNKKQQRLA